MADAGARPASWARLLTLFTAVTLIEAAFYGQLAAFIPLHLADFGIPPEGVKAWTGAIAAFASGIGIPLVPLWGALADRLSRKVIIVRTFVIHVVAALVMLAAPNIYVFAFGRALMAFSNGDTALMLASMGERAPGHRLGFAFALINGALSVGAFTGSLLGGPVFDHYGFNTLLAITGTLIFGVLMALLVGFREAPRPRPQQPLLAYALTSLRLIVRSPALRTLFVAQMVMGIAWMGVNTYLPLRIAALGDGNDPGTLVGIVLAAGGLGTLVASPLLGALADRIGYWRMLFAGIIVLIGLWLLATVADRLLPFMLLWAALSGANAAVSSISFNILSQIVDAEARGRIMVYAYVPLNFGSFIGPLVASLVTGQSLLALFPTAAALSVLGLLFFAHTRRLHEASGASAQRA